MNTLVDRLEGLSNLSEIPRVELEWLAEYGELEVYEPGAVVAPEGQPVDRLWVVLSGHTAVNVDRGAGPRRIMEWRSGEVSGMLPYSRMTAPPGDNYVEERSELLTIHRPIGRRPGPRAQQSRLCDGTGREAAAVVPSRSRSHVQGPWRCRPE